MAKVRDLFEVSRVKLDRVRFTSPHVRLIEAARLLRINKIGALPVMEEEKLVGIITERDFTYKVVAGGINPNHMTVEAFMTKEPSTVTLQTDLVDCLNLMEEKEIRHLPVVENGKLVGIISIRDVLHLLHNNQALLTQQFEAFILGAR